MAKRMTMEERLDRARRENRRLRRKHRAEVEKLNGSISLLLLIRDKLKIQISDLEVQYERFQQIHTNDIGTVHAALQKMRQNAADLESVLSQFYLNPGTFPERKKESGNG